MRKLIATGRGTNLKTGKEIQFKIPESISTKGLESIRRNIKVTRFELEEFYVMLLCCRLTWEVFSQARDNPNITTEKIEIIRELHNKVVQGLRHAKAGPEEDTRIPPAAQNFRP